MTDANYVKRENSLLNTSNFFSERNMKNASHGKMLSICIVIFEIIFLLIAVVSHSTGAFQTFNYNFYITMYVTLIGVSSVYYVLLRRYKASTPSLSYQKKYYYLTVGFGYLFITWGMLVSFADQGLYSNLNAMFINLIAIASFLYIAPKDSIILFMSQGIVFFVFISRFQRDMDVLIGHYINSAVIFVFMWLASFLSYTVFTSDYLNKSKLEKQLNINHEINEELKDAVQKLEALVIEDSLTELPNRRGLEKFLKNVESVYKREKTWVSFIMIDIDYFKQYNDHYSHMAGDDTLKRISSKLKTFVTSLNDYVIRFGGEEFLFINVSRSRKEMMAVAERMRQEIERLEIPHDRSECSKIVTISLGLVTTTVGDKAWIDLQISNADRALYKAKSLGRNCVYVMDDSETL